MQFRNLSKDTLNIKFISGFRLILLFVFFITSYSLNEIYRVKPGTYNTWFMLETIDCHNIFKLT